MSEIFRRARRREVVRDGTRPLQIWLPSHQLRSLRLLAVESDCSISELVRGWILDGMAAHKPPGGPRAA